MDQRTNEAERLIQSNFVVVPYLREAKNNKDKEVNKEVILQILKVQELISEIKKDEA